MDVGIAMTLFRLSRGTPYVGDENVHSSIKPTMNVHIGMKKVSARIDLGYSECILAESEDSLLDVDVHPKRKTTTVPEAPGIP